MQEVKLNEYVKIRVGSCYQKFDNGIATGWIQNVERQGNTAIFDISYTYPEGPQYQEPQRYRFAVQCESSPTPDIGALKDVRDCLDNVLRHRPVEELQKWGVYDSITLLDKLLASRG